MRISVYITSYNQRDYLEEALGSALNQTLRPYEIIIVDDCSTDGTQELIHSYCSAYPDLIKPIYHDHNTGVTHSRIDALNAVSGDYVTYMDGDDRFLPQKLEKEAQLLSQNPLAHIAFSNNIYVNDEGVPLWTWITDTQPPQGDVFFHTFSRTFPRRSLFRMEMVHFHSWKTIGFHDPALSLYEDYDMRIRLTKYLKAVYFDQPLSEIRFHARGLSSSDWENHFRALDHIYRKNQHLLKDLAPKERRALRVFLKPWIANIAMLGVRSESSNATPLKQLSLYFQAIRYNPALIFRIIPELHFISTHTLKRKFSQYDKS